MILPTMEVYKLLRYFIKKFIKSKFEYPNINFVCLFSRSCLSEYDLMQPLNVRISRFFLLNGE